MTKFFVKFKKPCFWPISPILGAKKVFPKCQVLSCTTSSVFLAPCQYKKTTNENTWTDRRTDKQTLFCRTLPATTRGPTSTTAVEWDLNQLNSSTYSLGTAGSYELNCETHF